MTKGAPGTWAIDLDDVDSHKAIPINDEKYQLTSSIYYGVRSYLHYFYEPSSRPFTNDGSGMVGSFTHLFHSRRSSFQIISTYLIRPFEIRVREYYNNFVDYYTRICSFP